MNVEKRLKMILLANTPLTRELGLMCRQPLEKNQCAFFDFKKKGKYSFWNKNVEFPISLLFCDENFSIKHIGYLKENQLESISSNSSDIRYVVEAHSNLPLEWNLKIGDKISIQEHEVLFNGTNS